MDDPANMAAIDEALSIANAPVHRPPTPTVSMHDDKGIDFKGGLIAAPVHGRTDKIPLNIPSGSYVLPADVVSALGQGNTIAGAKTIQQVMLDAPYHAPAGAYGSSVMPIKHGGGPPGVHPGGPPAPPGAPSNGMPWISRVTKPGRAKGGRAGPSTPAAGIMFVSPGAPPRVLMLKRSTAGDHAGEWCFPGGKIEPGEAPERAAVREAQEEVGMAPHGPIIPISHRDVDGVAFTTYMVVVLKPFQPKLDHEHTEWRWAPLNALPQPLHPGCMVALEKLARRVPRPAPRAEGGKVELVPIIAAGGEYVLQPHECRWIGDGDLNEGHKRLDGFVVATRKKLRDTLGKLEPPRRD